MTVTMELRRETWNGDEPHVTMDGSIVITDTAGIDHTFLVRDEGYFKQANIPADQFNSATKICGFATINGQRVKVTWIEPDLPKADHRDRHFALYARADNTHLLSSGKPIFTCHPW